MKLSARFDQALLLAAELHREQHRKGSGTPYLSHLLGVAAIALEYGANEDEAIAALLHDAVEDQGGPPTLERIRRAFGDGVAEIVWGCTDTDDTVKPPWRARKEAYIRHLAGASASVRLVSGSDKLHNVRTLVADHRAHGDAVFQRFKGGKDGTLWYYRALVTTLGEAERNALVDELERVVIELERLTGGGGNT
jgi:(p)ppGpp synthase/HD superfamily hydrolase